MASWNGYDPSMEANKFGNVYIINYLDLSGRLIVQNSGDTSLNRLFVMGDASFNSNVYVSGNITTNLNLNANTDVSLNNRLFVMGDASFNSNVYVNGNITTNLNFTANTDISLNNRLFVMGDASFVSNVYVNGNITTNLNFTASRDASFNSNVYINRDISCNGNISIGRNLTVSGNLAVKNYTSQNIINTTTTNYQLIVSEDLSLNGRLAVSSDTSLNGNLYVNGNVGIQISNPVGILDICGSRVRTTISQSGNIGIGTLTSNCPLHVISTGSVDASYNGVVVDCTNNSSSTADSIVGIRVGGASGGNPFISQNIPSRVAWSIGMDNSDNNFKLATSWDTFTNNAKMTIRRDINFVGIGSSWSYSPQSYLQVYGNTLASASSNADTGSNHHLVLTSIPSGTQPSTPYSMAFGYDVSNNIGYINARGNSNNIPICFQTRGGNLGIGLTNPTAQLHVNDTIKMNNTPTLTSSMKQILLAGTVGVALTTGTVTFSTAFTAAPAVLASINVSNTTLVYKININSVSATGFTWGKYYNTSATSFNVANAPVESFSWIAIGI